MSEWRGAFPPARSSERGVRIVLHLPPTTLALLDVLSGMLQTDVDGAVIESLRRTFVALYRPGEAASQ